MFCTYCGKEVKDDVIFCPNCGKQLKKSDNNIERDEFYQKPQSQKPTKKKWPKYGVLLFVLCFLALPIAFIVYLIVILSGNIFAVDRWFSSMLIMFCFIAIPIASLVIGILSLKKNEKGLGNLIVGIIFSLMFLSLLNAVTIDSSDFYSTDYKKDASYITSLTHVSLPLNGNDKTIFMTATKDSVTTIVPIYTYLEFTDSAEISIFDLYVETSWALIVNELDTGLKQIDAMDYMTFYIYDTGSLQNYVDQNSDYTYATLFYDKDASCFLFLNQSGTYVIGTNGASIQINI